MPSTPIRPEMTEHAAVVRAWLMRTPKPATLRVYATTGQEYDITIKPGAAWSDTAMSIMSLDPERIEASDAAGTLVRAVLVKDLVAKQVQAQQQVQTHAATIAALQSTDPETQRLLAFATLIAAAHDRATAAIENTVGVAFERMQGICDGLAAQATASTASANELSVAIRNLLVQQAQDARDETEGNLSPFEKFAANFMSGQQMAQHEQQAAAAATNGKPNGKH
jgi:hypothetical protein